MKSGNSSCDYLAGLHLAVGILAALIQRGSTGRGQLVDVSLLESAAACLDGYPLWTALAGVVPSRRGNLHLSGLPYYSVYPCRDGYIAIAGAGSARQRFFDLIGRPDLLPPPSPLDKDIHDRWCDEVVAAISGWTSDKTFDELQPILDDIGAGNELVRDMGHIWRDAQLVERGMILSHPYRDAGEIPMVGSPIHMEDTEVTVRRPPPEIGADNRWVLEEVLRYGEERIETLLSGGTLWG